MDWTHILVAVIAAIPGIIAYLSQRRKQSVEIEKTEAETADVLTESAERVVKMQEVQLCKLEKKMLEISVETAKGQVRLAALELAIDTYKQQINDLVAIIEALVAQLKELGSEPKVDMSALERIKSANGKCYS